MLPLVERSHRCEMLYTSPPFWTQRRKRSDAGALFCRHAVVNAKGHWVGISELHPKSAHDVFMPVEYPKQWVLDCRRFWNEQYLLQTFLSFNAAFEVGRALDAYQPSGSTHEGLSFLQSRRVAW